MSYISTKLLKKKKSFQKNNQEYAVPKHMGEKYCKGIFSSVQFSRSVGSDSLRPHESQHASTPCPSPTPRAKVLGS